MIVASLRIGRPESETVNVASARRPCEETPVTCPTVTPAIRTGDLGFSGPTFSNVACSWYPGLVNGMCFVNARYMATASRAATTRPIFAGLGPW